MATPISAEVPQHRRRAAPAIRPAGRGALRPRHAGWDLPTFDPADGETTPAWGTALMVSLAFWALLAALLVL